MGLTGTVVGAILNERIAARAHRRAVESDHRAWLRSKYDYAADALGNLLEVLEVDPSMVIEFGEDQSDAVEIWLGWINRLNEVLKDLRVLRAHPNDDVAESARTLLAQTVRLQSDTLNYRVGPGDITRTDLVSRWGVVSENAESLLHALRLSAHDPPK
ncbi:hypothetical protein [Actinospongicola halichondriae]|uniref:hypothetical protein n=1 Tax=Actinospongicola halichondriae TaxID=3236844 RepID=UPI003D5B00B2